MMRSSVGGCRDIGENSDARAGGASDGVANFSAHAPIAQHFFRCPSAWWISGTTSFQPIDFGNHRAMPDTTVIPNSATKSNEPISAAPEQSRSTNLI